MTASFGTGGLLAADSVMETVCWAKTTEKLKKKHKTAAAPEKKRGFLVKKVICKIRFLIIRALKTGFPRLEKMAFFAGHSMRKVT